MAKGKDTKSTHEMGRLNKTTFKKGSQEWNFSIAELSIAEALN